MTAQTKSFNPWPYGIVAAFVIFIVATTGLIVLMCRNPMDLVTPDYYEQEIRYQGRLDEMNRAAALGGGGKVNADEAAGCLRVSVPAIAMSGKITGTLQLYRPSAAGLDREWKLELDAAGTQTIDAKDLLPGHWKARLRWNAGGQDYFTEQSLFLPVTKGASTP